MYRGPNPRPSLPRSYDNVTFTIGDRTVSQMVPLLAKALYPEKRWLRFPELAVKRLPLPRPLRNPDDGPVDLVARIGNDPDVNCHQCERPVTVRKLHHISRKSASIYMRVTSILNAGKADSAQPQFSATCGSCHSPITRKKLGVARFTRDVVLDPDDPIHAGVYQKVVWLPSANSPKASDFSITWSSRTFLMASELLSPAMAQRDQGLIKPNGCLLERPASTPEAPKSVLRR
ncbi:hypothetical protein BDM02DRAFT_3126592 [Thelephora ganbajun]|uniref:Uncharacterized protein n=1 Tax=Thelephora ganbajun TaxID=370292 RepID=A0ACB6ZRW1_THEGA|nr:hypothetical protein BDM02DRAFT_3126592 [Thelephora ganbajun]